MISFSSSEISSSSESGKLELFCSSEQLLHSSILEDLKELEEDGGVSRVPKLPLDSLSDGRSRSAGLTSAR